MKRAKKRKRANSAQEYGTIEGQSEATTLVLS